MPSHPRQDWMLPSNPSSSCCYMELAFTNPPISCAQFLGDQNPRNGTMYFSSSINRIYPDASSLGPCPEHCQSTERNLVIHVSGALLLHRGVSTQLCLELCCDECHVENSSQSPTVIKCVREIKPLSQIVAVCPSAKVVLTRVSFFTQCDHFPALTGFLTACQPRMDTYGQVQH